MRAIRASRSPATRATARRRTSRLSPAVPLRRCTAARSVRCGAPGVLESPMSQAFVHLRLHTEYSLSDSVVRVPELVAAVAGMGMAAVAVTDEGNLFAMVKFYRAALKAGLKPIVGVDLQVAEAGEPRQPPTRVTLLCQSRAGYRNLTRLVSRAYLEGLARGTARIERGWLSPDVLEGLIGLSCATEGDIGRALISARERDAERALDAWQALLPGRFYLELQRLGKPFEETYIAGVVALAARRGAPVVATNDVRFLEPGQFESHEARVCIHDGTLLADTGRVRRYSRQQYLRKPQARAGRWAPGGARGRARWSPTASRSPISIRSATTCCSSVSSTPSASRCPISTSISAWTAATGSSSTSRASTAASVCRRSSPTAPWRRRRWCATSAGCSAWPTATSTASPSSFPSSSASRSMPRSSASRSSSASIRARTRSEISSTWRARSRGSPATPACTPAAW